MSQIYMIFSYYQLMTICVLAVYYEERTHEVQQVLLMTRLSAKERHMAGCGFERDSLRLTKIVQRVFLRSGGRFYMLEHARQKRISHIHQTVSMRLTHVAISISISLF